MKPILLVLVIACALAMQRGTIPPTDDPTHEGQPQFCINNDTAKYVHNCDCQPRIGDKACNDPDRGGENPKCSVYCRKSSCKCERECQRTE